MKIQLLVKRAISVILGRIGCSREKSHVKNCIHASGLGLPRLREEKDWYAYWSPITKRNPIESFRLYGQYSTPSRGIISQCIADVVNRYLSPLQYRSFYADKNTFDILLPNMILPRTIARKFQGMFLSDNYKTISISDVLNRADKYTRVIVKPSVDSNSGRGVVVFTKNDKGVFCSSKGIKFDRAFLENCGDNVIIQECLMQHPFMSRFNSSSVNTLRIATYRSVKDNTVHVLSTVIRMGATGSDVDNLHSGGHMVGVSENGILDDFCVDTYGVKSDSHNDVNFKEERFVVPNWEHVKALAISVAE